MIKTSIQEFITLNKPMIYCYLIDVSFFVYTVPLSKASTKILKNGNSFVGRFEDLDFSFVLLVFFSMK